MTIGIIGLGLMGGSLARAVRKKTSYSVFGFDASPKAMQKAFSLNAIDEELTEANAGEVDILVVAVSPDKFLSSTERFLPKMKDGAIVNDFCGVKGGIVKAMQTLSQSFPKLSFIGGHPMSGREFSGIEHSRVGLFDGAPMLLVNVNACESSSEKLKEFYSEVGFGQIIFTTAEEHDRIIAYTSQLCHVVSNAFIKNDTATKHFGFSAGSYKDLTRVAKLDADMWAELMIENSTNLLRELKELTASLKEYETALEKGDKNRLRELLFEGSERKKSIDEREEKR